MAVDPVCVEDRCLRVLICNNARWKSVKRENLELDGSMQGAQDLVEDMLVLVPVHAL
eukprot:CAMPEP_0197937668 /NCGR_PEP_ID=MMETSP1439-20131203/116891_1 /TAXON_ID=66791 /ORGANISM="Gonyaulax spinifera, Strain CCMP409" /LENGTH=56 /DNA_ID=CAMNT_0043560701 /DNA_START=65 /DNA_END=235 /DNA_ORIENTATION=-